MIIRKFTFDGVKSSAENLIEKINKELKQYNLLLVVDDKNCDNFKVEKTDKP